MQIQREKNTTFTRLNNICETEGSATTPPLRGGGQMFKRYTKCKIEKTIDEHSNYSNLFALHSTN